MAKFSAAIGLAFTGKADTVDRMRTDFLQRVKQLMGGGRTPAQPQTIAERYRLAEWQARVDAFVQLEHTASFVPRAGNEDQVQ